MIWFWPRRGVEVWGCDLFDGRGCLFLGSEDVEVHEGAGVGGGFFAVAAYHLAGGTGGGEVDVDADAAFGQGLDVALGAHEFQVFVEGGSFEDGIAFGVMFAEVAKSELAQAADAGGYGGFSYAPGEGELFEAGDEGLVGIEAAVDDVGVV